MGTALNNIVNMNDLKLKVSKNEKYRNQRDKLKILLNKLFNLDNEIHKTEQEISLLIQKQKVVEVGMLKKRHLNKHLIMCQNQFKVICQQIYTENKIKATESHLRLGKLVSKMVLPLYNQPSDTVIYHKNKTKYMAVKQRLLKQLQLKACEKHKIESHLVALYAKLSQAWILKLQKNESELHNKADFQKRKRYFQTIFPELKKDSLSRLHKKSIPNAVVPPILLTAEQRKLYFLNNNNRIEDFHMELKEHQKLHLWTESEKKVFLQKLLCFPKQFGIIASFLKSKSTGDCINFYYLNKRKENFKQLLLENKTKKNILIQSN